MKTPTVIVFFFLLLGTSTAQERKFQFWNLNTVAVGLWKDVRFEATEKVHFTPENQDFDLVLGDLWLKNQPLHWLEYGTGFRMVHSRKEVGWRDERRAMLLANLYGGLHHFGLSLSNRFEYRTFEYAANHFRYREMITLDFPEIRPLNINFYASEEGFLKLNPESWHLVRYYTGIQTVNIRKFEMKVYYAFERNKSGRIWNLTDIVGMNMRFEL